MIKIDLNCQVWFSNRRAKWRRHQRMNLLKRNASPSRHGSSNSASNQIAFTPGSPRNVATSANQSQISPQSHRHVSQNHQKNATAQPAIVSSATASIPLLMGGEHSAFRALNSSTTAALLAASAQLGLARSYAASLVNNNNSSSNNNNNVASSTSTNQSPPVSPHQSESDEEINVHDAESDTETSNASKRNSRLDYKTPLELTKRN